MKKRSNLHSILTISISLVWGIREFLALQRVYCRRRQIINFVRDTGVSTQ